MKHYRIRPFSTWGEKRAPLSATKVRANSVCNIEITTRKYNLPTPIIPCREACAKLPHNVIAPQSKACQVRFSKPLLRTVKSAFSRLFSCLPLLSVLPLHYENETQGQLQGHREIKRKSLCLADVTLTNYRDALHLYVQLKLNNMTKQKTMIEELKYRIARYRSMGNGVMCQSLYNQLRALKAEQ